MLCLKPYRQGVAEYGCGKCLPCRIKRRRLWTVRLLMEAQSYADDEILFVTLTYDDDSVPVDGSLQRRDLDLFLKRLRKRLEPRKVRHYCVGEYGERGGRPHYHGILFGVRSVDDVRACWTQGFVHVGTFSEQSAAYVAGYVTNFRTGVTDVEKERLNGRYREFASISRRPYGLGARAMEQLARRLELKDGAKLVASVGDVPFTMRANGSSWSFGRYLRRKLREHGGVQQDIAKDLAELENWWQSVKLSYPGERERRELMREQHQRSARVRESIVKSKGKL